ncbi:MAG: hypothetical protein COA73_18545 [Candidatus Hydrogenedentota bacterium]|nr:MAG: hypothetical protein COA73_18545 [Candidatus Hydrogenedentota bacterium]
MPKPTQKIFTLRIALCDSKPEIWRRFQIRDDMTLGKLHDVIQIVMGWDDSHLHEFEDGKQCYSKILPDEESFGESPINEDEIVVEQILNRKKKKLMYNYDMGDYWQHILVVEEIGEPDPKTFYPNCLEGAYAGPPEDCGGVWGYQNMLEALADPNHDEHEFVVEWIGEEYDAEEFDLKGINKVLKNFKRYRSGWDDFDGKY